MKQILLMLVLALAGGAVYVGSQQPHFWCNSEWAGISLVRGGYRSWTMRFCDGYTLHDGKWSPVTLKIISTNPPQTEILYRHYRFPAFAHTDARALAQP